MRRSVSGETPTLKLDEENSVTVRQVPLTEMESPRWQSVRMSAQSEMVREVPPPPEADASSWLSSETAACVAGQLGRSRADGMVRIGVLPIVSTMPVNMLFEVRSGFGIVDGFDQMIN